MNAETYERTLLSLKLAGILVKFSKAVGAWVRPHMAGDGVDAESCLCSH